MVDDSVTCLRSLFSVDSERFGVATYLTAPALALVNGDDSTNDLRSYALCGTDRNLLVYSTTGGYIVGQDVRVQEPVWYMKQDRAHGRCSFFVDIYL